MIGLEYLLELYKIQHKDLAEELGIKKQNINAWIKGVRKIPEKHLQILERKFNVEKKYIIEELSDEEKFQLQKIKLKNDVDKLPEEFQNIGFELEWIDFYNEENKTLKEIKRCIRNLTLAEKEAEKKNEAVNEGEILYTLNKRVEIFNLITKFVNEKEEYIYILKKMIPAFEYINSTEQIENKFIADIVNSIKKEKERVTERINERNKINEINKWRNFFNQNEEEIYGRNK